MQFGFGQLSPVEIAPPFGIGPIRADTSRNYVYLVDSTYNRLLAINTATGVQDYGVDIEDGTTSGEMTISVDGTTLYLAENQEDKILAFTLPNLAPKTSLSVGFPPTSIAAGSGGRLYATSTNGTNSSVIYEISTSNGSILQTFGSTEQYYSAPLIRTNFDGTNLYAAETGLDGYISIYKYDISGSQASAAVGYPFESENLIDFAPDEPYSRIYLMNGGIYGINVLNTTTDNYATDWKFVGAYGVAVSFNSQGTVVYGGSGDAYSGDLREFSRTDGAPLADWIVSDSSAENAYAIVHRGVAATANGNVVYVRASESDNYAVPFELGFLSTLGQGITLVPSRTQTINFTTITAGVAGQTITLNATSSSGLDVTYAVVSGPGSINGNQLTFTGAGSVVISATQAGNGVYKPVTTTQTITVPKAAQTISSFSTIANHTYGDPAFSVSVPTASSGLAVSIYVKSGPATISGSTVTITGAGTVTLGAQQPGNAIYAASPEVTVSFSVAQKAQTIAALARIPNKDFGVAPFSIAVPAASSGLPVALAIESGPANISANIITLTGAGTVVVEATQAGNANYLAAPTVTTQFEVIGSSQTITPFKAIGTRVYSPTPFAITLPTASSGLPVDVEVTAGPATLSQDMITLTGPGTVTLTATQAGNSGYAAAKPVTISFAVKQAPQSLTPFAAIAAKSYGAAPFAIPPPVSSAGLPVTVTVKSGPATFADNVVTLTGVGAVTLGATAAGNADYLPAAPVTTTFTVAKEAQSIGALATITTQAFSTTPLTVTEPTATSGLPVTLKVKSGPAKLVGTTLTLTGIGTVVLAADQAGNADFAPATEVTTSFAVTKNSQTISDFASLPSPSYGAAPYAITLPTASSGLPVKVTVVSGPAVIAGDKITLKGAGIVTLAANQAGNADFAAASEVTATFTVAKEVQTIAAFATIPTKAANAKPFTFVIPKATSKLLVSVAVTSGPATISGSQITLNGGTGTVVLTATQAGNTDYASATPVTTSFEVQ
jgi:hypothetical protein